MGTKKAERKGKSLGFVLTIPEEMADTFTVWAENVGVSVSEVVLSILRREIEENTVG